jgi:hypothetical protein
LAILARVNETVHCANFLFVDVKLSVSKLKS